MRNVQKKAIAAAYAIGKFHHNCIWANKVPELAQRDPLLYPAGSERV